MENYHLKISFGDTIIPITTAVLRELTIVQSINAFLPEFRLRISDNTGTFTHVAPFDRNMSNVSIELAPDDTSLDINSFNFTVYRRKPGADQSTPATIYDIQGLLTSNNLFGPDYSRSFSGNMKTNLEGIGTNELLTNNNEVSISLDYNKTLLQPLWSNIQFLKYLKENLVGVNGEYGYKSFIKCYRQKTTFVFRSISEMIQDQVVHKFILQDTPYEDRLPIFEYSMFDNYQIYGSFASKKQDYSYFDYLTSTFTSGSEDVQSYLSMSDYYLIDKSDSEDSNEIADTGRSNDFTSNFAGQVKGSYGNRLNSLVKLWITTQGSPNILPGQTIEIFFPHGAESDALYSYQYSGYWLIEQVVHNCGSVFMTKLLLTRPGLDTDKKTTLLKATNKKKK